MGVLRQREFFQHRVRAGSPDEAAVRLDEVVEKKTGRQVARVCFLKETHVDGWYEFMAELK